MKFEEKVYFLTKKIPQGKVATYKKIAERVGNPKSYRAVGNALNKNLHLVKVPCHRVVKSTGFIGGYALGVEKKRKLLEKEGVK
jgi:methylated-DNA-[protein]-cysteine S-methyltransferase